MIELNFRVKWKFTSPLRSSLKQRMRSQSIGNNYICLRLIIIFSTEKNGPLLPTFARLCRWNWLFMKNSNSLVRHFFCTRVCMLACDLAGCSSRSGDVSGCVCVSFFFLPRATASTYHSNPDLFSQLLIESRSRDMYTYVSYLLMFAISKAVFTNA